MMWEALNTISLSICLTMCESGHLLALSIRNVLSCCKPHIGSLILVMILKLQGEMLGEYSECSKSSNPQLWSRCRRLSASCGMLSFPPCYCTCLKWFWIYCTDCSPTPGDIPIIANSLKCGTTRAVKTLNSILGFTEFDRSSRNKIRNFSTFPKEFRVEEHREKILTEFSLPDFISVANLLHLDVETNEQNVCNSIFKALTNLDEFQLTLNNSETSFSESENVVSKTTFQKRITLDRNFSSEGTDQHSPFQHPVSNAPLPSVQAISSSQKLIFAKRLVCGTAKSFLFSQRNLNTYESFKKALIEEFSDSVTSIEIHHELEKRKMYKTETLMQYFNSMRELANRCDSKIDEASIIQYVINGIDGPRSDKIILYGATSFSEFKQKLRTYETVIKNMGIHNSNSPNFRQSYESRGRDFKQQSFQRKHTKFNVSDAAKNPLRCFNCNDIGHLSKSCPNHSRGLRCLSCNLYGHKSFECRRVNLNNTSTPPSGVNSVHKLPSPINMCKDVTIFGRKHNELVDTGSN
ncbi:uncharacterized protein LOC105457711 [Trichonephila clavipes]|nr:uncharacterized protein LOC105457711 [Trichonephila clavipes]